MTVHIQISKDYALASDTHQWLVKKYTGIDKKTGEQKWQSIKYCSTLGHAAQILYDLKLRESDCHSLAELFEYGEKLKQEINNKAGL